jgi:hypothetical protein
MVLQLATLKYPKCMKANFWLIEHLKPALKSAFFAFLSWFYTFLFRAAEAEQTQYVIEDAHNPIAKGYSLRLRLS